MIKFRSEEKINIAQTLHDIKEARKELKRQEDKLTAEIKEMLGGEVGAEGLFKAQVGELIAKIVEVTYKPTYDKKLLEKHIDAETLEKCKTTKKPTTRFDFKLKKIS